MVYLAGPAAEGINGEVFVVHGGVAAVMEPPRIRTTFLAAEHGSADGMWTLESVHEALDPVFNSGAPGPAAGSAGFACEDTLTLASETIGFATPGGAPDSGAANSGAANSRESSG